MMFGNFFFRLFFLSFLAVTSLIVHAQNDQSGFISIDCGIPEGSSYNDSTTGIQYSSDKGFTDVGISRPVSQEYETNEQQLLNLRSFPDGIRNCYNLRPNKGKNNKYLIRVRFMYGNYDRKNIMPEFDVHLGVEYWNTVTIDKSDDLIWFDIIHIPTSDNISVCFINTGHGTPFVSVLELRPLGDHNLYSTKSGSLDCIVRWNLGSTTDDYVRYPDDNYDRIWTMPGETTTTTNLITLSDVDMNGYEISPKVMSTAITPINARGNLTVSWYPRNITYSQYYIYTHFAEVEALNPNQSRTFNIYLNGYLWAGPFSPPYLTSYTMYSESPDSCSNNKLYCELRLNLTDNSTLPPIINALEIYQVISFEDLETDENEFDALMNIKSTYNVTRNWQGDPCAPEEYVWDGVNCSYDGFNSLRVISLDLSSSALTGGISIRISDLKTLQYLDLSNNSLTGQVPDFLTQMTSLKLLKLNGNNFTGSIPAGLLDEANKGSLSLSIDGLVNNTKPCQSPPCQKKKKKSLVAPIVASVAAVSAGLVAGGLTFLWMVKKRKKQQVVTRVESEGNDNNCTIETKNRQFTYSEVLSMTNNFQKVIGKGGFGTVYHGYNNETQVAVKMLSPSSIQGYKEFQAEVMLLMNVHHKNLTPLVGYCNEGTNMGIIYEYMAHGNLAKHLSDKNVYVIGWEERLRIAIDAAQGLEYLHHGCKPPIVHRDVKSTNILLTENLQGKLADFGLSRMFTIEGDTHVSTRVAGTPGYLDPEYYASNRLTEKSDVYGFGIVLLEMVAGRPAIPRTHDKTHIVQWVNSTLQQGDVKNIIDPRLRDEFDVNSVWKAVELAMICASRTSTKRPTMDYVVMELKECLAVEIAYRHNSKDAVGLMTMNIETELGPQER